VNKNCSLCLYNDGIRGDGTYRCCTPERQRDDTVKDCCILERPLRKLQARAQTGPEYTDVTINYVLEQKAQSIYWQKIIGTNG
jgi:hypothetical protein